MFKKLEENMSMMKKWNGKYIVLKPKWKFSTWKIQYLKFKYVWMGWIAD